MLTTAQWVSVGLSLFVAVTGSSVAVVAVTAWVNRNKMPVDINKTKADAAATLSNTAIALSTAQGATLERLRVAWHEHREWDKRQVQKMRDAGWRDVEDPPDLWI